jgi:hypothetical protein
MEFFKVSNAFWWLSNHFRVMQLILTGLTWSQCLAYLDDIIVLGKDFEDHLKNLALSLRLKLELWMKCLKR